jgi:hypothetical protein
LTNPLRVQWVEEVDEGVSKIRQPVERIFNWLIEKVDIQKAGKVRSNKGLMIHAFGKLATAFITLAI